MGATTVKLDAEILKQIASAKPAGQTLSQFVRDVLKRDLRRRRMKQAGEEYQRLLRASPAEAADQEEWEAAALAISPRKRK